MSERPLWRLVAGRKAGPYPPEKLRPLMKDGRISSLDRFSYDGSDWRPPAEFPELLRPPTPAVVPSAPQRGGDAAVDPLEGDAQAGIDWPDRNGGSGGFAPAAEHVVDDAATKKLLAMINGLIWVGVGVVVILVTLMVITTVFYKPVTGNPAPVTAEKQSPAAPDKSDSGSATTAEPRKQEVAKSPPDEASSPPTGDPGADNETPASSVASPGFKPPGESAKSPAGPRVPVLP